MFAPAIDQQLWLEKLQAFLHYYLPPVESTPAVNVGGLVAVLVGLVLVFRGGKYERLVVCAFALVMGGWLGYRLSIIADVPGPITVALAGVLLSVIAYKTYRWWLATGSVLVLFGIALVFQLGRGDLSKYLPSNEKTQIPIKGEGLAGLASEADQMGNLHPHFQDQLRKMGGRLLDEMKQLDIVAWIVPIAAAIAGGLLAFWALRTFAVVWLGLLGAGMAILGGSAVLCANWPALRDHVFAKPHIPGGIAIGLWLIGLTLQAKAARFPKKIAREPEKDPAKS
jgi:hypothetical protein